MLIDKLKPFEHSIRALYAAALGKDTAQDDAHINADGTSGRLMLVRNGSRVLEASLLDERNSRRKPTVSIVVRRLNNPPNIWYSKK